MPHTKTILFVLTSHDKLGDTGRDTGFWLSEAAHPWRVFTDAGYRVELASIQGGRPPVDGADPADPVQRDFLALPDLNNTPALQEIDPTHYDAVLYVGGHGSMWDFPGNPTVATIGSTIYAAGGVVAAVCHGPVALLDLTHPNGTPIVTGRNLTSFTNAEEHESGTADTLPFFLQTALENRGAQHTSTGIYTPHVVVDGQLITGQNPSSARPLAEAVVEALSTRSD